MLSIRKWDPFAELSTLHREMDEFFRRTLSGLTPGFFKGEWYPLVESYMRGDHLVVRVDLPGVNPRDVDISILGNQLVIKGERKAEKEEKKGEYFYRETSYGRFERVLTLPEGVNTDKVHATYKDGILEITMPARAEALPKKITVEVEGEKKEQKAA